MILSFCELSLSLSIRVICDAFVILVFVIMQQLASSFLLESENRVYYCFIFYIIIFSWILPCKIPCKRKARKHMFVLCPQLPLMFTHCIIEIFFLVFLNFLFQCANVPSTIHFKGSGLFLWPVMLLFFCYILYCLI